MAYITIFLGTVASVLLVLVIRCTWIRRNREDYFEKVNAYLLSNLNEIGVEDTLNDINAYFDLLWEQRYMMFYIGYWNFDDMVYDLERYRKVNEWAKDNMGVIDILH